MECLVFPGGLGRGGRGGTVRARTHRRGGQGTREEWEGAGGGEGNEGKVVGGEKGEREEDRDVWRSCRWGEVTESG